MPEEIKQELVLKTQKTLGKYVKKPPLTEKLLKKPPFRFLHDIVNAVIRETGFLKGLFSEDELNSDNVKERDAKVAFLSKLIEAVKTITATDLAVKPSKIVAGLEPTETNLLLQTIGKALDKKLDSTEYVKQLNSGRIVNDKTKKRKSLDKNEKSKKPVKSNEIKNLTPKSDQRQSKETQDKEKKTERNRSKDSKSKDENKVDKEKKVKNSKPIKEKEEIKDEPEKQQPEATVEKTEDINEKNEPLVEVTQAISAEPKPSENEKVKRNASASRPKSARPRSGDLREKEEPIEIQSRPKSSLRPPSVRPSSARPGAPRLRPESAFPTKEVVPMGKINVIVENFDRDDDEETVIIQSSEVVEEKTENIDSVDNKGHLVEQILEQINQSNNVLDAEKETFYGKDTAKETTNLRNLIQAVTKTANPLGKLLNYLHEDVDAMYAELEMWTHTKKQLFEEISKQKKIGTELNKPLIVQLENLNQELKKMEEEIVTTRSNILRNDERIQELLTK